MDPDIEAKNTFLFLKSSKEFWTIKSKKSQSFHSFSEIMILYYLSLILLDAVHSAA